MKFADLGLLVVDEEQRFGVRHKERLKQMRKQVDVLTMSATPIPRTLHMSLVGLRDMSVIETPPKDRIAIQTVVASWDEKLIQSAIEQELERGGQVYFVHNRVDSIWEIAAKLQALVPRARIIVGHGQMSEGELEKVMLKFMHHEADILVSTTIIENGLDIPLCNTILINRADRLGLSELYQLRGRVGRSNRRAYAYLLLPAEIELTPIARRRLAALKEFSDLGAGFKIAALDLELRGAGNLLGGEQSGHIEAIGFELYTQMLDRAVREMKGEAAPDEAETQLNLGLNIRIPVDYIPEENQRLRMYKRVAGVETESQLERCSRRTARPLRRSAGPGAEPSGVCGAEAAGDPGGCDCHRAQARSGEHQVSPECGNRPGKTGEVRFVPARRAVRSGRHAEISFQKQCLQQKCWLNCEGCWRICRLRRKFCPPYHLDALFLMEGCSQHQLVIVYALDWKSAWPSGLVACCFAVNSSLQKK